MIHGSTNFVLYRLKITNEIIRILHECEVLIENSVPRVTVWHHEAPPRDRFVDQYLKLMIDSFSCTPTSTLNIFTSTLNISHSRQPF